MPQNLYAVYGVSGAGRQVMPLARQQLQEMGVPHERLVFVDDSVGSSVVNGQRVLSYQQFLSESAVERYVAFGIGNGATREKLAIRCIGDGVLPWAVQASNVVIMDDVEIAEGAILSVFTTLTSNIRIGKYFYANHYSQVSHDCVIGDFVTFAPGARCNGHVVIEDHAYIGAGAVIKQGTHERPLTIGKGAVIGMGAVVTKDVPPGVTVVGNPARPLVKV